MAGFGDWRDALRRVRGSFARASKVNQYECVYLSYAGPCAPVYKKPASVDDCLSQAERMITKIGPSERPRVGGGSVGLYVSPGDKVLIVTLPDQDKYVAQAVTAALKERGAEKVDFIYPHELLGKHPERYSVEDGWREAVLLKRGLASGTLIDQMTGLGLGEATRKYLDVHPEYTSVYLDVGGSNSRRALQQHIGRYRGGWGFNNWEKFLSRANIFPLELWNKIETRIVEPLGNASQVRITDPEGTYLEFRLTDEEAKRWQMYVRGVQGHLYFNPLFATSGENREAKGENVDTPPVFPKTTGVLAGTSNHCGFFPRIEVYFEQDRVVEVKGGGRYGDEIREMMELYKDVHWPGYPAKGYFWFCDMGLFTSVGVFRRKSDIFNSYLLQPNMPESSRAGVFHMGFGSRYYRTQKEFIGYAKRRNLPLGHIHLHIYFATLEMKLRGTNYWHKIVDKGFITALDDPEIRATCTKFGDPDKLLRYDWIPPLPGINCEGDYVRDYAPDPASYLKKRLDENKTI